MSADNGYLIRKVEDKFRVSMYFDSAEEYPPVDKYCAEFDDLEEAFKYASELYSEYGVTVLSGDSFTNCKTCGDVHDDCGEWK